MPAESATTSVAAPLGEKLERVTLARALLVTLLLTSAVVLNVNDLDSFSNPTYTGIWYLIIATYVATVGYAAFIRYAPRLEPLAFVQAVGDSLLAGGLVLLTGGSDSIFVFLFFLAIVNAANLLGREGALFCASVCSIVFGFTVISQGGHVPALSELLVLVGASGTVPLYNVAVVLGAFFAVAVLAGHLAERLGQAGTELERWRLDVRQLRALNENIVNSIAGGLITLGRSGRVIDVSAGAAEILGVSANHLLGSRAGETLPILLGEVQRFEEEQGNSLHTQVWLEREDAEPVYVSLSVAPLTDGTGRKTGHILHFADRTAMHELQKHVQQQKRLAAVGELSAAIAHEIRNPLASVSGAIQMLGDLASGDGPEKRLMTIALREIDRLNDLVEDFLAYARPSSMRRTRVDLGAIVRETAALLDQSPELSDGVTVQINLGDDQLIVDADEAAMRQIFWNLLRNAAEALDGDGVITIEAQIIFAGAEPRVEVTIADTGAGFAPDAEARLFEPFFTTKEGGTGLGLATVHRLVAAHDGMIVAESSVTGATFRLMLPCWLRESTDEPRHTPGD